MAITTYNELLQAVRDYNDNAGPSVVEREADFVMLAEKRMMFGVRDAQHNSEPLRCRAMEESAYLVVPNYVEAGTSSGSANAQTATSTIAGTACSFTAGFTNTAALTFTLNGTVTGAVKKGANLFDLEVGDVTQGRRSFLYHDGTNWLRAPKAGCVPLPSRFLGVRTIYIDGTTTNLDFIHSDDLGSNVGNNYSIDGNFLVVSSGVAAAMNLDVKYYRALRPLSVALNDVFLEAPHIYLWATLLESSLYLQDNENAAKYHGLYAGSVSGYLNSSMSDSEGRTRLFVNTHKVIV